MFFIFLTFKMGLIKKKLNELMLVVRNRVWHFVGTNNYLLSTWDV